MTHPDPARPSTAQDVLAALADAALHTRNGTLAWLTGLGNAVLNRPADMTLDDLRKDLMAHNGGTMPDGASKGNLSKAATTYRVLVRDGALDPHLLIGNSHTKPPSAYRQRDLYAAAVAVESGELTIGQVLYVLASGNIHQYKPDEPAKPRSPKAPDPDEPTPDTDPLDEVIRQVYAAALVGADAAGMHVLEWVRKQAALAVVG
jgi:hypothetical protein